MKHDASKESPPVKSGVARPVICWTRNGVPICCEYQAADDKYLSTETGLSIDCVEWQEIE